MIGKSERNPGGWTVASLWEAMVDLKAKYPEMPGVIMYGPANGNATCGANLTKHTCAAKDPATLALTLEANKMMREFYPDSPGPATFAPTAPDFAPTGAAVMDDVQLLYNNDGENLWAVDSSTAPHPYHPKTGSGIDAATIRGSAQDVAGIADVDLICPFHNVPWWNSSLEPPAAHRDWYDKTFGFSWAAGDPKDSRVSQLDFVLAGGDFVGEFADECTSTGQKPFVAIRLNDGQMCNHPPTPDNCSSGVNNDHQFDRLSRFWWEHKTNASMILGLQQKPSEGFRPCCWLPMDQGGCKCSNSACEFSWASPTAGGGWALSPAAARLTALVGEVATMYAKKGVQGVELDFERGLDYFATDVPPTARRRLMGGFLAQIRGALPEGAAFGLRLTPRWAELRGQGLDNLKMLVTPVKHGGQGVSYFSWGIYFVSAITL